MVLGDLGDSLYTWRHVEVKLYAQVLSDALLLEGVPIGVTQVSNKSGSSTTYSSCVHPSPTTYLFAKRQIIVLYIDVRTCLYLKKL